MIVSGELQRDSVIHKHVSVLPQTPLPSRLPHNIEQSSMSYIVGPCWLSILKIAVCTCVDATLPNYPFPSSFSLEGCVLCAYSFRCFRLFATPWTTTHQTPLSMGFSRQEYWMGCHFFSRRSSQPRDQTQVSHTAGGFFTEFTQGSPWKDNYQAELFILHPIPNQQIQG